MLGDPQNQSDRAQTRDATRPEASPADTAPRLTDRRRFPAGVMPARLQQWVIAGIAVVMVAILALAGPPAPKPSTSPGSTAPLAVDPNGQRIEDYQRRVQEQAARLAAEQAALQQTRDAVQAQSSTLDAPAFGPPGGNTRPAPAFSSEAEAVGGASTTVGATAPASPARISDNVVYSRAPQAQQPVTSLQAPQTLSLASGGFGLDTQGGPVTALALPPGFFNPVTTPIAPAPARDNAAASTAPNSQGVATAPSPASANTSRPDSRRTQTASNGAARYTLSEGTFIDAVLTNRLDGSFEGPVNALVSVPVWADGQIVIPAGARVLGQARPVSAFGQTRLAVAFHRILLPDGRRIDLDGVPALNQAGDLGLHDQVDRHYGEIFGTSIALGLLAGFTQGQTPTGFEATADDRYRQVIASSFGQSGTRVLDRFLNLLPTVTVREGHRLRVYMTHDLELPAYATTDRTTGTANPFPGGDR